jgi:hypothetical protein
MPPRPISIAFIKGEVERLAKVWEKASGARADWTNESWIQQQQGLRREQNPIMGAF